MYINYIRINFVYTNLVFLVFRNKTVYFLISLFADILFRVIRLFMFRLICILYYISKRNIIHSDMLIDNAYA
jgi:hypothetical protein